MTATKRPTPPVTLGSTSPGDIVCISAPHVLSDGHVIPPGTLLLIVNNDLAGCVFVRYAVNGGSDWSKGGPYPVPKSVGCSLVSSGAERAMRGVQ